MGAVYRAEDTKLDRDVAIKVLPEAFVADEERLARFEREAKVLAALNHPNIAGIYEVDEVDGVHFLAMELADGEDLSDRMARGPVPVDEAITIALQIAEGLEAAHARGIVHRDLKPANVKIGPDGQVKILDFGLAKAWEGPSEASPNITASPTLTAQMTQAGVILGTAAYMSPEQARGEEADQRADVWAFGVILLEMLTGVQLFHEPTVSDTLAAVLRADLDLDALPAGTPWRVRDVLGRCLDRDPHERMHSIADVRIELGRLDEPAAEAPETTVPRSSRARILPWAVAAVLALSLAGALLNPGAEIADEAVVHFEIELPPGYSIERNGVSVDISPDGSRIVIRGDAGTQSRLFLRDLDDPVLHEIPGTEGAVNGFFSPDGNWIGFVSTGKLRKISLETNTVVEITEADWGGGAWGESGTIVYTPTYVDGLWMVSADGGVASELTHPDKERKELGHFWPQFLPGETHVLFTNFKPPLQETRIEVVEVASGERRILVEGAAHGRYVDTGHLIFTRNETLFAVPFNAATLELAGGAVPLLADIAYNEYQGNAFLATSPAGMLAFTRSSVLNAPGRLVWVDRGGSEEDAFPDRRQFLDPVVSPDGRRIALAIRDGQPDIWILDVGRGSLQRLTDSQFSETSPVWSPDGREIIYIFDSPPYDLFRVASDGSGTPSPVLEDETDKIPGGVSPNGDLVFERSDTFGTSQWRVSLAGGEPELMSRSKYDEGRFSYSPDGEWVAFASTETGQYEVFVRAATPDAVKHQVSIDGGANPLWSRAGGEIFFRRGSQMMAVSVRTDPELVIGQPEVLFSGEYATSTTNRMYDVGPDGRFVMIKIPPGTEPRKISIILNFDELLKRTLPLE